MTGSLQLQQDGELLVAPSTLPPQFAAFPDGRLLGVVVGSQPAGVDRLRPRRGVLVPNLQWSSSPPTLATCLPRPALA